MKHRRLLWAFGAGSAMAMLVVVACSEGGNGTGFPLKKGTTIPTGDIDGASGGEDDGSPGGDRDGGGTDCGFTTGIHNDAGPFCTFMADGGKKGCAFGQHCCIYPQSASKASTCNNAGTPCDPEVDSGGADFECDEPADCTGGKRCCFAGTATPDAVCPNKARFDNLRGTYCATACSGSDLTVCTQPSDCSGSTCRLMNPKSKTVGACVQ